MPGKDKPHREAKKPKKNVKKESVSQVISETPEVEVIKKGKKEKEEF